MKKRISAAIIAAMMLLSACVAALPSGEAITRAEFVLLMSQNFGDGSLELEADITREQAAVYMLRYAQSAGAGPVGMWAVRLDYADLAEISEWAIEAVMFAAIHGLIEARPGNMFDPQGTVTRAEAEAMLERLALAIAPDTAAEQDASPFAAKAFEHFLSLLEIPRGSGYEQQVSDFLVAFAEENGLEAIQDDALNVLIRKPGSAGRENEPPVILQAHMDIVWDKNEGVEHDFRSDPITPIFDGDWVRADGTTLGADNGAGLAIIMAVLEDTDISHPPIEAVITTEEETGMGGAMAFDISLLEGRRFINIDGDAEADFTVSCASSVSAIVTVPVTYEAPAEGHSAFRLTISGLIGGHSGVDIHRGRASANEMLAEPLYYLIRAFNGRLAYIAGGNADNAIPRESSAIVLFDAQNLDEALLILDEAKSTFMERHPVEENMSITLEEAEVPAQVMDNASGRAVIGTIFSTHIGVWAMSPHIEDFVQTSNNLGVIETQDGAVIMTNYMRSSDLDDEAELIAYFEQMGEDMNVQVDITIQTRPWVLREDSPLRDLMAEVYIDFFGREPNIIAVHAGLECAVFAAQMPDGDFISIGMDILDLHSPDERMYIPSFNRIADFVVRVLAELT